MYSYDFEEESTSASSQGKTCDRYEIGDDDDELIDRYERALLAEEEAFDHKCFLLVMSGTFL